jgi:heme-degrading monooxygenase HmoA
MFARMHTLETTADGQQQGIELLRDLLPWMRDTTGFRGILRLSTPDRSKTLTITLWATEEAMQASAEAARGLGTLAAEASGSTVLSMEDYEVVFFEGELVGKEEPE